MRNPYLLALNYAATITIGLLTGLVFTHLPFVRPVAPEVVAPLQRFGACFPARLTPMVAPTQNV